MVWKENMASVNCVRKTSEQRCQFLLQLGNAERPGDEIVSEYACCSPVVLRSREVWGDLADSDPMPLPRRRAEPFIFLGDLPYLPTPILPRPLPFSSLVTWLSNSSFWRPTLPSLNSLIFPLVSPHDSSTRRSVSFGLIYHAENMKGLFCSLLTKCIMYWDQLGARKC